MLEYSSHSLAHHWYLFRVGMFWINQCSKLQFHHVFGKKRRIRDKIAVIAFV